jgi:hypothetical protein
VAEDNSSDNHKIRIKFCIFRCAIALQVTKRIAHDPTFTYLIVERIVHVAVDPAPKQLEVVEKLEATEKFPEGK